MSATAGKSEKFIQMTTAPVEGLVCKLAVPSIIIMLISSLYNMADTYFVGALGTSAVAAVGVAFPIMTLIQALGFFFGQGSGNFMARALGAQQNKRAAQMAATGFFSAFLSLLVLALAGLISLSGLSQLLGATPTILPYANEYIRFILVSAPFMAASMVLNQQLRFQGSAVYALVGMITGAVLNVFLDPLFIFVFKLGIAGASSATCISQTVSCIILFAGCSRKENIRIRLKNFSPSLSMYGEMIKGGIPALFRQGLMSVSSIAINHFAGVYGDAAIAAISITNRVFMFATSVMLGFGQGFQPVCGFNYGAKLYGRVKKAFWFCVRLCSMGLLIISLILAYFSPQIVALFRKDDLDVIEIGAFCLRMHCISMPFNAWIIMCNMLTQTIGKALEASILAAARQGLFMIPTLLIFTPLWGLLGIQLSRPTAEVATFFFAIPLAVNVLREMKETPGTESGGGTAGA
jgi:putative MATE family efflux protein